MEAAGEMICAYSPPQRKGSVKQPIAQLSRFSDQSFGQWTAIDRVRAIIPESVWRRRP
jgi:hypothetical protein